MTNKIHLVFFPKNKEVQLVSADGKESLIFGTRDDTIDALVKCRKEKQITPEEFTALAEEVLNALELPWKEKKRKLVIGVAVMSGELIFPLGMVRTEVMSDSSEETYFKMCTPGAKHGHIYRGDGILVQPLVSKKQAFRLVEAGQKKGLFSDSEVNKLLREIEDSPLPEIHTRDLEEMGIQN